MTAMTPRARPARHARRAPETIDRARLRACCREIGFVHVSSRCCRNSTLTETRAPDGRVTQCLSHVSITIVVVVVVASVHKLMKTNRCARARVHTFFVARHSIATSNPNSLTRLPHLSNDNEDDDDDETIAFALPHPFPVACERRCRRVVQVVAQHCASH